MSHLALTKELILLYLLPWCFFDPLRYLLQSLEAHSEKLSSSFMSVMHPQIKTINWLDLFIFMLHNYMLNPNRPECCHSGSDTICHVPNNNNNRFDKILMTYAFSTVRRLLRLFSTHLLEYSLVFRIPLGYCKTTHETHKFMSKAWTYGRIFFFQYGTILYLVTITVIFLPH